MGVASTLQDGLRKRMETLKQTIIEASQAVEEEKRKNVELLHMVFPEHIAPKLWRGKKQIPYGITITYSTETVAR